MHLNIRQIEPFGRPFDFGNTRQKGEDVSPALGQRAADRGSHVILDPVAGPSDMMMRERPRPPRAFHNRRVEQRPKPRAIQCCRHCDDAQIRPKAALCIQRKGQPGIAVEAAFMDFIEQDSGDPRQIGFHLYPVTEDRFGDDEDTRFRRAFDVHPRGIADGLADPLTRQSRHSLGCGSGRNPAWREQEDFAGAPMLGQQGRRNSRRLSRARWCHNDEIRCDAQVRQDVGQDVVNGERN
jgi:hypothetical protein